MLLTSDKGSGIMINAEVTLNSNGTMEKVAADVPAYWSYSVNASGGDNYILTLTHKETSSYYKLYSIQGAVVRNVTMKSSQTITHDTNVTGEVGTFCETNGGIYDGYDKIAETDCICQVVQSTELNQRIVGIITGENQFASHGDVLVKVVNGTYALGDILVPDSSGKARKATDEEKVFMVVNAIPRAKITSLQTGIDHTVACFLV